MKRWWKVWASVAGGAVLIPAMVYAYLRGSTVDVDRADEAALMEWFTANEAAFRVFGVVLALFALVLAGCAVAAVVRLFSKVGQPFGRG